MKLAFRWILLAWLTFIGICIAVISKTEFVADLSAFLPNHPTPTQKILVDQLKDGVVSRLILIGIEGDSSDLLAQHSKTLAAKLRKDERFVVVNNGEEIGFEKDREFLWRNRYLLSPQLDDPNHFSTTSLQTSLEDYLQLLGSPASSLIQKILPNDPSGELLGLINQMEGEAKPFTQQGVWFTKDSKRAVLFVQTRAAGSDMDAQEIAIDAIKSSFHEIDKIGKSKLLLTGPGVFSVQSRDSITKDAALFSTIATIMITIMMLALYRSPRVLGLGLLPVATGVLGGIAAVSIIFGSVHGITLGFGATLIGEAGDYAVYLLTQISPGSNPRKTFDRLWPTLRLGVLTSICGFGAMLFSGFSGLAQLGVFSIAGLIVAVSVTRWVLPSLVPAGFSAQAVASFTPLVMKAVHNAPRLRYVLWMSVGIAIASLFFVKHSFWSDDLASLSPVSKKDQQLDEQLRNSLGAPDVRYLIITSAKDQESALQATEAIARDLKTLIDKNLLQGFDSPALFFPSEETQKQRQATIPDEVILKKNLDQALTDLPFQKDLFAPFIQDANQAKRSPIITRDHLNGTGLAVKLDSLLLKRNNNYVAMMPLKGVKDEKAVAQEITSRYQNQEVIFLDLKKETDSLYLTYRKEIINYSLLGILCIAVLLFISLRSVKRVIHVLLPLGAALVITFAITVATIGSLSIFHIVGFLLVVGVGSNYSLFFDDELSDKEDRERTLTSLLFANISTVIGFGLLSLSNLPVLNAIGLTVGIGAILSLVFSAVLSKQVSHV